MFGKLKSLDRINITPKSSSFTNELLLEAWLLGCNNRYFNRAMKEFVAILMALQQVDLKLNHLSHDQVPILFFVLKKDLLTKLASPLRHLTSLRLTLDATTSPDTKAWDGLGKFLQAASNLKYLRFGFAPFENGSLNRGTWQDEKKPQTLVYSTLENAR